jgi:NAD(P)H-flavin reductase/hemoglobin-like flavoprotein
MDALTTTPAQADPESGPVPVGKAEGERENSDVAASPEESRTDESPDGGSDGDGDGGWSWFSPTRPKSGATTRSSAPPEPSRQAMRYVPRPRIAPVPDEAAQGADRPQPHPEHSRPAPGAAAARTQPPATSPYPARPAPGQAHPAAGAPARPADRTAPLPRRLPDEADGFPAPQPTPRLTDQRLTDQGLPDQQRPDQQRQDQQSPGRPRQDGRRQDAPAPADQAQDSPPASEPRPAEPRPAETFTAEPRPADPAASPDAVRIRRTMAAIEPISDKVVSYFYATLFLHHPYLRELFPASMDHQRDRLMRALLTAAKHVDDSETLGAYLAGLGRGHRKYGTRPEHYPAVGEALITALARYAGEVWDEETEAAWVRAYTVISQTMIDAAAADEKVAPAWWHAEIVAHEKRTPKVAVITVRPDQPYPFLAGQYTMVETPWWPRVWRHYSFASAPASSGLLTFHVKAVPAGWVSSALVHHARPGDVIRMGPPAGEMVVDHSSPNGLLCLGGGTGIAPIKALVEDVAESGVRRPIEVFYGARNDTDLYDLDTMLRLAQRHPWVSVRPVVSDGPTKGLAGSLPEVVRQYGPWHSFDAYLSGPAPMIRSSVDALVRTGIPPHRIRHDFVGDLRVDDEE